jgi:L-threonine kinase
VSEPSRASSFDQGWETEKMNWVRAGVPSSCGELVQGIWEGRPCLVSCPISRFSVGEIRLGTEPGWEAPTDAPKAVASLYAGLEYLGHRQQGGQLRLASDLPRGRGYGSSTADIGATLFSLGWALGCPLSPEEASRLAVEVEPTDSTLFPGLTLFDHLAGRFHEPLGPAPPLSVVVLDPGGGVDTVAYNRLVRQEALRPLAHEHQTAFALLRDGLKEQDWEMLGEAATLSARVHQAVLDNPLLVQALALSREVGAVGVCRAHSGTLLGLLLDPCHVEVSSVVNFIKRRLPGQVAVADYSLVGGGPHHPVSFPGCWEAETRLADEPPQHEESAGRRQMPSRASGENWD